MKLLQFHTPDGVHFGVLDENGVFDVTAASGGRIDMAGLFCGKHRDELERLLADAPRERLPFERLHLAPCIPKPGKIIGVGLNYVHYMEAQHLPQPPFPHLFPKFGESLRASGEPVAVPRGSVQTDFEGELAVVIGKRARCVSKENALEHVFGYCSANDLTARDFQDETPSWVPGKCCNGFTPLGPYLTTADEVPDPYALRVRAWVNGELRQDFRTDDMIRDIHFLISGISRYFTLNPGDVLLTGTSVGHIMLDPPERRRWLTPGDVVEVEVEGLGRLVTLFVEDSL